MTRKTVIVAVLGAAMAAGALWWSGRDSDDDNTSSGVQDAGASNPATPGPRRDTVHNPLVSLPSWFGQRGKARNIAGRVVQDGQPTTAQVTLSLGRFDRADGKRWTIDTDEGGTFDFGPLLPGTYQVMAQKPGTAPAVAVVDLRNPAASPPPDKLLLTLTECLYKVTGTIADASGGAIAGARVRLASPDQPLGPPRALSGDDGAYIACFGQSERSRSAVQIEVTAEGYAGAIIRVRTADAITRDFALVPEAIITGRVIAATTPAGPAEASNDDDDNGQLLGSEIPGQDAGQPIAGAMVSADVQGSVPGQRGAVVNAETDAQGRFQLVGLRGGALSVRAEAPGWVRSSGQEVIAQPGQTTADVIIRLQPASSIAGVITAEKQPVAGATIHWFAMGGPRAGSIQQTLRLRGPQGVQASLGERAWSAVSQGDGSFVLDDVPPGPGSFWVEGHEVVAPTSFTVPAPPAPGATGVVVEVKAMASVSGVVKRDDAPAPHAAVRLQSSDGVHRGAQSDENGGFTLSDLGPGDYTVSANDGVAFSSDQAISLHAGQRMDNLVFELVLAASVSGQVVNQDGEAVPGALVRLQRPAAGPANKADRASTTVEEDGTFTVGGLAGGGSYQVQVESSEGVALTPVKGGAFAAVDVAHESHQVTGVTIAVQYLRTEISGVVVGSTGEPRPDVEVQAVAETSPGSAVMFGGGIMAESTTDMDGRFTLNIAGPGGKTFAINARSPDGASGLVKGVAPGASGVKVILAESGSIVGTVTGFSSEVRMRAFRFGGSSGKVSRQASAEPGGSFSFDGLPPGTYNLIAGSREGERGAAKVEVVPGQQATVELVGAAP